MESTTLQYSRRGDGPIVARTGTTYRRLCQRLYRREETTDTPAPNGLEIEHEELGGKIDSTLVCNMKYDDLVANAHTDLLKSRNILYIIETSEFQKAFDIATDQARAHVRHLLDLRDVEAIRQWVRTQLHKTKSYEELTVKELRKIARMRGICDYNYMGKVELLVELAEHDNNE